ncbi:protein YIPF3-like [Ixodes scapularis]|uniref:protein YIPF3-like n=1 Tax=Ixodes scapularis TaxID=6945 RepID=UPI001AD72A26|nr:protein YIPF3-like [Ixodes scapularis]
MHCRSLDHIQQGSVAPCVIQRRWCPHPRRFPALPEVAVFAAKTASVSHKAVAASTAALLHLLALLYFHFAYHRMVEALDGI